MTTSNLYVQKSWIGERDLWKDFQHSPFENDPGGGGRGDLLQKRALCDELRVPSSLARRRQQNTAKFSLTPVPGKASGRPGAVENAPASNQTPPFFGSATLIARFPDETTGMTKIAGGDESEQLIYM